MVFQVKTGEVFFFSAALKQSGNDRLANAYPSSLAFHSPNSKAKVAEAARCQGEPSDKVCEIADAPGKLTEKKQDSNTAGL